MQQQKTGDNTVKPLKQIHTVEVTGSNPVPPTSKKGATEISAAPF
jgi:hypothetical protein